MIKQTLLIVVFLSISLCLKAQTNLVVDGSFEDATPNQNNNYFWWSVNQWKNPNEYGTPTPTPDYYNDLANGTVRPSYNVIMHQPPKHGYGVVALFAFHSGFPNIAREYVQGAFTNELEAGKRYEVKFYVSLVNNYRVAVKHIGAYLSTEPITFTYRCELEPQLESNTILSDTLNWMEIKGEYIAQGGEKHITLGNFRDDKQSDTLVLPVGVNMNSELYSYYFIDDVSVVCLDCPQDSSSTVGIKEQTQAKNVKYNNSTNTLSVSERGNLVIYNMQGVKVKELLVSSQDVVNIGDIGVSGIYIWQFQTDKEVQRSKFLINER